MECFLCKKNEDLLVKQYERWTLIVHPNQYYLGRCILKLNRHIVDLFDITEDEQDELFSIMKDVKNALSESFRPDFFNYASLGNKVEHLHMHVIPRYKDKRTFDGITFMDGRWGHNYKPYDKSFNVPESTLEKIRKEIASLL